MLHPGGIPACYTQVVYPPPYHQRWYTRLPTINGGIPHIDQVGYPHIDQVGYPHTHHGVYPPYPPWCTPCPPRYTLYIPGTTVTAVHGLSMQTVHNDDALGSALRLITEIGPRESLFVLKV